MKERRLREALAETSFKARLLEALRSQEFRTACIQRLVAATIDAAEGGRIMDLAVDRVREAARGSDLARRLLRAVDAACTDYAEMRSLPYRKVVGPMIRNWKDLMSAAQKAGLTEEEAYAVMRDLLRKIPASHWSKVKDVERELLAEMRLGLYLFGLATGRGEAPPQSPFRPLTV